MDILIENLHDSELLEPWLDDAILFIPVNAWGLSLFEPARHKLLHALTAEPKRIADLVQELDRSAPAIAADLAELEEQGVVFSRVVNLGCGERTRYFRACAGRLEVAATLH
ncbi:MAG: hypothetical protein K0Q68_1560 [Moraxellaceae bacterium]|jgi:predicted Rossmann fold nucleotide-binding protein DprA/Smf involved in DNA uptake|nr:hypothetical protein [Moraxellaceae bacterium]